MASELARLVVTLEAQTSQYVQQLDKANAKLASFEKATEGALKGIEKAFKTIGVGLGVTELVHQLGELSDSYTAIQNKLRPVTSSTSELAAVQEEVFKVAQSSHASFESTAELYARLADSADGLGFSQKDLLKITETVTKAIALEGASSEESAAAAVTFAKGLADGSLAGGEIQKTLKNFPNLAAAIAHGLGVDVAQLKFLAEQGKLTTGSLLTAIESQAAAVSIPFSKMAPEISKAFTNLHNAAIQFFGQLAQSAAGSGFASTVQTIADNIANLSKVLLVGATAWAAYRGAVVVSQMAAATKTFLELFTAVASGNAVLLGSAAAEGARAAASAEAAAAEAAKTAAVAAGVRAELAELDALLAATAATTENTGAILVNARGQAVYTASLEASNALLFQRAALLTQLAAVEAGAAAAQTAATAAAARAAAGAAKSSGAFGLLGGAVSGLLAPFRGLVALVLANPWVALATAVVAAVAALAIFSGDISTSTDGVVTLRDTAIAAWQLIAEGLSPLTSAVATAFKFIVDSAKTTFSKVEELAKPALKVLAATFEFTGIPTAIRALDALIDKVGEKVQARAREIAQLRNLAPVDVTVKAIGNEGASDPAALKKIQDMEKALRAQITTQNEGAVATIRYRITQGDLADEFAKAGAAADPYRKSLVALTGQIEAFKIQTLVRDLQQQIATQDMGAASTLKYRIEQGDLKVTFDDLGKSVDPLKQKLIELAGAQDALKLQDMARDLQQQVATFDQSGTAVLKYRLAVGDLAKTLNDSGAAGQAAADNMVKFQSQLDQLQVAKQLKDINAQVLELQGNTAEAAAIKFDTSNLELRAKLIEQNNQAGLADLDNLRAQAVAQAKFTELQTEAGRVQANLAVQEDRIRNSQQVGALGESQALAETGKAREAALSQLQAIETRMNAVASSVNNPAIADGVKKFGSEIDNLKAQTDLLGQSIRNNFQNAFSDSLASFIDGTKSAGDAFRDFVSDIVAQIAKLAAQNLAQSLFGAAANATGGSGGQGGWTSALAAIFGGGKALGGPVDAGMAYKVNERTAKSEWFIPQTAGQIVPAEKMGGGGPQIHQTFVIQAPQGTVSRQTQQQIGALAARNLGEASRRNN